MSGSQAVASPSHAACDPLGAATHLRHSGEFYPYGFPAVIRSNSPLILSAAQESWGYLPKRFDEAPIEIRCVVSEGGYGTPEGPPVFRAQGNLLTAVADRENHFCCDLERGFGFGWVTEAAALGGGYLRDHFLEGVAYSLLNTRHIVLLHAACVVFAGHGVLLAGDSGAGKSSLAYACARRGWTYTSDDATSLVRRGGGRAVVGDPRYFRLRSNSTGLFPELQGRRITRRGSGKPTIEVKSASLASVRTAFEACIDHIVFLNRSSGDPSGARLVRVSGAEALDRLLLCPWPAELPICAEQRAAVARLAEAPAHELRYCDLEGAMDRLEELVHEAS